MEKYRETLLIKEVHHYKERLENYKKNRYDIKLLHYLGRLSNLPIEIMHLKNTGIGLTVNNLRELGGDVGVVATSLVVKWKKMVIEEFENKEILVTTSEEKIENSEEEKQHNQELDNQNSRNKEKRKCVKKRSENNIPRDEETEKDHVKEQKRERSKYKDILIKKFSTLKNRHEGRRRNVNEYSSKKHPSKKLKIQKGRIYDSDSDEEALKEQPRDRPQEEKKKEHNHRKQEAERSKSKHPKKHNKNTKGTSKNSTRSPSSVRNFFFC